MSRAFVTTIIDFSQPIGEGPMNVAVGPGSDAHVVTCGGVYMYVSRPEDAAVLAAAFTQAAVELRAGVQELAASVGGEGEPASTADSRRVTADTDVNSVELTAKGSPLLASQEETS